MKQSLILLRQFETYDLQNRDSLLEPYKRNLDEAIQRFLVQFNHDFHGACSVDCTDSTLLQSYLEAALADEVSQQDVATLQKLHLLIGRVLSPDQMEDQDVIPRLRVLYQALQQKTLHVFQAQGTLAGLLAIIASAKADSWEEPRVVAELEKIETGLVDIKLSGRPAMEDLLDLQSKVLSLSQSGTGANKKYIVFLNNIFRGDLSGLLEQLAAASPDEIICHYKHTHAVLPGLINVLMLARKNNLNNPQLILQLDAITRRVSRWQRQGRMDDLGEIVEQLEIISKSVGCENKTFIRLANHMLQDGNVLGDIKVEITPEIHQSGMELPRKARKVALVDIDGTLILKSGGINLNLIAKLKEYDDVILFTQRSKFLQISNIYSVLAMLAPEAAVPEHITTSHVILALQAHGINPVGVSSSVDPFFGEPMCYYDGAQMEAFEAEAFEMGLEVKLHPDRQPQGLSSLTREIEADNKHIQSRLASQSDDSQQHAPPDQYYPKNKVVQYAHLLRELKSRYSDAQLEVSVFDDQADNLGEILDSKLIPECDKPVAFLVDSYSCAPLLMRLPGIDQEKYSRLLFKNLALFVDYLLALRSLNTQSVHHGLLEQQVDEVIERLFRIKSAMQFDAALLDIAAPLEVISKIPDLNLLTPDVTPVDLLSAIRGNPSATPARMLIEYVRQEFHSDHSDSEFSQGIKDARTLTVGEFHIARLLRPAQRNFTRFYQALFESSYDDDAMNDTEHEHVLETKYNRFLATADSLGRLGLKDAAPSLMRAAISNFFKTTEIDIIGYYKLRAFSQVLEYKSDLSADKSRYYMGLSFYFEQAGGIIDQARINILTGIAYKKGIRNPEEVDTFIEQNVDHFEALARKELMAALVSRYPLAEIPARIRELIPIKDDRNRFNREFFEYQVTHAYEIHYRQMKLTIYDDLDHAAKRLYEQRLAEFPHDHFNYKLATKRNEGLSLVALSKTQGMDRKTNPIYDQLIRESETEYETAKQELRAHCRKEVYERARDARIQAGDEVARQFIIHIKSLIKIRDGKPESEFWAVR
ncbi:hypothetical protein AQUSIP_10530 [Aquicella siphonis]|uniref:Uncharacterized protein n=1 Tax=Aquicella siphonis TaxID=254247 RepID=A0A5E4PFJ8_9COXI|nr:hypothetical protein [Aquicella siphonis]VVC75759.1 hypothetical protein AQUSIP_10530 [Aquicella siphonis]